MAERILITGGSGFIGANLTRALIDAGNDVFLLLRPDHQRWRLADLEGHYTPLIADLRDIDTVRRQVAACRPEVIYHLATHGTLPVERDRAAVISTCVTGTANLLDALAGNDYRAFVHAGSSSEYGHKDWPIREDDQLEPRTDYAVGKAAASLLALAEAKRGRPVSVVRIFSSYGPWEDPSRIASTVMAACQRREAARVTAGDQPRDFIYVDDVVELLRVVADNPQAHGQVLHSGTGRRQTVRDMLEAIVRRCGGPPPIYGAQPQRPDEPAVWQASIERTSALTGWRPRVSLEEGVARMLNWFRAEFPLKNAA
jgi:nucleoside-diphosphate-sugar epimerase